MIQSFKAENNHYQGQHKCADLSWSHKWGEQSVLYCPKNDKNHYNLGISKSYGYDGMEDDI